MQQEESKYLSQVLQQNQEGYQNLPQISPMPEGSNQPELNIAPCLSGTTTLNDYQREVRNEGPWEHLYFRLLDGHSVQDAKLIDGFLYIYKGST